MVKFPECTKVGRRLPKEAFYQYVPLTPTLKKKFVSDVEGIFLENSLTAKNLNLPQETEIKEILLVSIHLKKQNFDEKIVEAIAKQNPHPLIFQLIYGPKQQLAVYYHTFYCSEWTCAADARLALEGNTLTAIWENLVRQIAIQPEIVHQQRTQTLAVQLKQQEKMDHLQKLIQKTEAAVWKERQPKKKFTLYTKLQEYKKQWEELTHGQA